MRKFIQLLIAFAFHFFFVLFLLLTTVRFQLLNPEFITSKISNTPAYVQLEQEIKNEVKSSVEKEFEKDTLGPADLPFDQRERLKEQIYKVIDSLESKDVQEAVETNITRFYSFLNGESNTIFLYLPVQRWGLPKEVTANTPLSQFSEETDIYTLISSEEEKQKLSSTLQQVQYYVGLSREAWFLSIIIALMLLSIHFLMSRSPGKFKPTSKLMFITGLLTMINSGLMYVSSNQIESKLSTTNELARIITGSIIPLIIQDIARLWLYIGIGLAVPGLLIFLISHFAPKRKVKKQDIKLPEQTYRTKLAQDATQTGSQQTPQSPPQPAETQPQVNTPPNTPPQSEQQT